jgi:hypothetical protein
MKISELKAKSAYEIGRVNDPLYLKASLDFCDKSVRLSKVLMIRSQVEATPLLTN